MKSRPRGEVRLALGLMSGTSADGVDAVLVRIEGSGSDACVTVLEHSFSPYPEHIRCTLADNPCGLTAWEICRLNFELGEFFAGAALECLRRAGIRPEEVDLIASHGQTMVHIPPGQEPGSTLQIGEPSVIAARTGIVTIADFRPADMAVGGQGAPLVPFADYVLFRHREKGRVILNIGGIANLTYLPPSARLEDVMAFDTGPGNMVLDALVHLASGGNLHMDEDARIARTGTVRSEILQTLLNDPYFSQAPPKSTGRERFGRQYARNILDRWPEVPLADLLRTVAELTVVSITEAVAKWVGPRGPVHELVVGGGGARNPLLMTRLREELPSVNVLTHKDLGLDDKAKEAVAFPLLGSETLSGNPSNVPAATGAKRAAILGKICFPPPGGPCPQPAASSFGTGEIRG